MALQTQELTGQLPLTATGDLGDSNLGVVVMLTRVGTPPKNSKARL